MIGDSLAGLGLRLQAKWLAECQQNIQISINSMTSIEGEDAKYFDRVYECFLHSNIRDSGAGCFPPDFALSRNKRIAGPLVVQVDAIKNIGAPDATRHKEGDRNRCLLLALSDGHQQALGLEYRPIPELRISTALGCKIALLNVRIKEGMLLLTRETVQVLGGGLHISLDQLSNGGLSIGQARAEQDERKPLLPSPPPPLVGVGSDLNRECSVAGEKGGAFHENRLRESTSLNLPVGHPRGSFNDDIDWTRVDVPSEYHQLVLWETQGTNAQRGEGRANQSHLNCVSPETSGVCSVLEDGDERRGSKRKRADGPASYSPEGAQGSNGGKPTPRTSRSGSEDKKAPSFHGPHSWASSPGMPSTASQSQGNLTTFSGEWPGVTLADVCGHLPGQHLRVKGVVTSISRARNTRSGLRITVHVSDGAGPDVEARLSDELVSQVLGLSAVAFSNLVIEDRAAAETVMKRLPPRLASLEGVFTLKVPAAGGSGADERRGQLEPGARTADCKKEIGKPITKPHLPILLSCEPPGAQEFMRLLHFCQIEYDHLWEKEDPAPLPSVRKSQTMEGNGNSGMHEGSPGHQQFMFLCERFTDSLGEARQSTTGTKEIIELSDEDSR